MSRAGSSVDAVQALTARADATVTDAERAVGSASAALGRAEGLLGVAEALLGHVRGPADQVLPLVQRLAESLSPQEVDAAIALVDRLPVLLDAVDSDVLPLMKTLEQVAPDLHGVLELVTDLHRLVSGVPGVKLLRRRGDDDPVQRQAEDQMPDAQSAG